MLNFCNKWFLRQLPKVIRKSFEKLILAFARKIYNLRTYLNTSKRNCNDYRHQLQTYGLLDHGNFNENTISPTSKQRRLKYLKNCVETLNNKIDASIDLEEYYLLHQLKNKPKIFKLIEPKMKMMWINEQNYFTRQLSKDNESAIRIAMSGLMAGLTQRQWNKFNKSVK